jgi:hypothetical protein
MVTAMTEEQPYDIVREEVGFEVRHYPAHVVAETTVDADFEQAGNRAFRSLFGYISGDNARRQSLAMTSPVVQATPSSSERIAMTSPVTQQAQDGRFVVAFVLPSTMSEETAPTPNRRDVSIRTVPPRLSAVARFTGRWTQSSYETHRAALLAAVAAAGLETIGKTRFARFDPPYAPWFLRHNEVAIDLAEPR